MAYSQQIALDDFQATEPTIDIFDSWNEFDKSHDTLSPVFGNTIVEDFKQSSFQRSAISPARIAKQPPPPIIKTQISTSKKRKRVTPKQQITRLRLLVHDVSLKLESVRAESQQQARQCYQDAPDSNETVEFWKRIASRQYQQRVASELENLRLRRIVKYRIAQAERMQGHAFKLINSATVT